MIDGLTSRIEAERMKNESLQTKVYLMHRDILKTRINQYQRQQDLKNRKSKVKESQSINKNYRKSLNMLKLSHFVEKMHNKLTNYNNDINQYQLVASSSDISLMDDIKRLKEENNKRKKNISENSSKKQELMNELDNLDHQYDEYKEKYEFLTKTLQDLKNNESIYDEDASEVLAEELDLEEESIEYGSLSVDEEFTKRSSELNEFENVIKMFESDWEELKADNIYSYNAKMKKLMWLQNQMDEINILRLKIDQQTQENFALKMKIYDNEK